MKQHVETNPHKKPRRKWDDVLYSRRDKRTNKPEFNRMAKKRRAKAKFDARQRKINQKVARRNR